MPHDEWLLEPLCAYLNGPDAARWLKGHCQRAANGFIRLQSTILKQLPLPIDIGQQVGAQIDLLHKPRAHYSKNTLRTPPRPEMDAK